jgi:hypothetical protein
MMYSGDRRKFGLSAADGTKNISAQDPRSRMRIAASSRGSARAATAAAG